MHNVAGSTVEPPPNAPRAVTTFAAQPGHPPQAVAPSDVRRRRVSLQFHSRDASVTMVASWGTHRRRRLQLSGSAPRHSACIRHCAATAHHATGRRGLARGPPDAGAIPATPHENRARAPGSTERSCGQSKTAGLNLGAHGQGVELQLPSALVCARNWGTCQGVETHPKFSKASPRPAASGPAPHLKRTGAHALQPARLQEKTRQCFGGD